MNNTPTANNADSIIEQIQQRDSKIKIAQKELVGQWVQQGLDMLILGEKYNYTQKNISEITGISVGSVNLYLTYASDTRLVSLLFTNESDNKCIDRFNQKELKKLTTLNNIDFNQTIESGVFPKSEKDDKSIELSAEELIQYKLEHIKQLQEEIKDLQAVTDVEVIDVIEVVEIEEPQQITEPLTDIELILKAIEKAGGGSALAKELGLHRSTVSGFKSGKPMTEEKRTLFINYLES